MSERTYNRLANILMFIAIGSAVLFDSGRLPHRVIGTIGILAGVAALALYFWNQYQVSEKKKGLHSSQQEGGVVEVAVAEGKPAKGAPGVSHFFFDDPSFRDKEVTRPGDFWRIAIFDKALEEHHRSVAQAWLDLYSKNYARNLRWSFAKGDTRTLMQPEVELSPKEVAACAIEIMRNLAISDQLKGEWEYSFGPKGLHVSLKRVHSSRPVISEEDFENADFGNVPSMVQ